jgi:hypothetical protein
VAREKEIHGGIMQGRTAAFGNAATRIKNYMGSRGAYEYGTYAEIDDLLAQPAPKIRDSNHNISAIQCRADILWPRPNGANGAG